MNCEIAKARVGVVDHRITRSPDHPMKWLATGHWPLAADHCPLLPAADFLRGWP